MSLLIVQLSDIHLSESNRHIMDRAEKIVDAALSPTCLFEAVHIVISGDLANWGLPNEFELGRSFIQTISDSVSQRCNVVPEIVVCAGNHDCHFSSDESLRDVAIDRVRANSTAISPRITEELASVLSAFYEFQRSVMPGVTQVDPWHATVAFSTPIPVKYVLLNSAVTSKKKEEIGKLYVRVPSESSPSDGSRTIYVAHHPFNWLLPDNGRELAQHASSSADLFLMGHEHVLGAHAVQDLYEETSTIYLRGHVLQDAEANENSAFQTIQVDADRGCMLRSYLWRNSRYEPWVERTRGSYTAWPEAGGRSKLAISSEGYKALTSPGANFTHRNKDVITLPDIFVWPQIRIVNPEKEVRAAAADALEINAEDLLDAKSSAPVVVIKGSEQMGKSALAKMLALNLSRRGLHPLLLTASNVSSWREKSLNDRIDKAVDELYGPKGRVEYRLLKPSQKVLLIDDFDLSQVTKGYFDGLRALRQHFSKIYLMLDSHPGLEVALNEFLNDESFLDSSIFEMLPSNYHHRLELIEKWLRIGNGEQADEEVRLTAARLSKVVDETLGRNLIPALPVFVLIVLQRAELSQDLNTVVKGGSQGFLYESLIHQALSAKVRVCSVVTSLTYLTSLASALRASGVDSLSQSDFEAFHVAHCKRFALDISVSKLQGQCVDAGILDATAELVRFKYPFHYYYFVARTLSQIKEWSELEPQIDGLIHSIHTERSANVLLFLAHIGRDARIAGKILEHADGMFSGYAGREADLFAKLPILQKYGQPEIRAIIFEGRRDAQLMELERDDLSAEHAQRELAQVAEERLKDRLEDALAMNAAFKTLQVLGQVLRNHAGEIEREEKSEIARSCVSLGLRVLGFLYEMSDAHGQEMISFRGAQIRVEKPNLSDPEIAEELERYLPSFLSNITVGTLMKVANAIGAEDLRPTLDDVLGASRTHELLKLVVQLEHFAEFPKREILDFEADVLTDGGFLPNAIFRRFIVRRFYLFPIRDELKRDVLERFKIKALPFKFLEQRQISG